jgi:glycosyltransferase involved in cell wall biosynthesis
MPWFLFQKSNGNLIIEGEVEDAVKYQEDKAIMFVPLLTGSGIRAKIIEGMSMGKTIISTLVGAQGIAYTNNENILIADTPEEFVTQFEKCVYSEQLCRKIGSNAKKFAIEKFNAKSCAKMMIDFYNKLV